MDKNVYQILEDWHGLLKSGAITESEFATKKTELLGSDRKKNTNQNEDFIIVRTPEEQASYDAEYELLFNNPTWFQKNKGWIIGMSIAAITCFIIWFYSNNNTKSSTSLENSNDQTFQSGKIDNKDIWAATFSTNPNLEEEGLLARKATIEGKELLLKTKIEKLFYYKSKLDEKCCVIFYSYDYTNGELANCHGCGPAKSIAQFTKRGNGWILEKFLPELDTNFSGNWGQGPSVSIKEFKGVKCLSFILETSHRGNSETIESVFNLKTFKWIK